MKPSQLRIESIFTQWNTIGIRGNNLIAKHNNIKLNAEWKNDGTKEYILYYYIYIKYKFIYSVGRQDSSGP